MVIPGYAISGQVSQRTESVTLRRPADDPPIHQDAESARYLRGGDVHIFRRGPLSEGENVKSLMTWAAYGF